MGTVSMGTKLKFEVFDVYDRMETKVCPIGAAHCEVMGLLRAPDQSQRHEILFDGSVCGYLTIRATQVLNMWRALRNLGTTLGVAMI